MGADNDNQAEDPSGGPHEPALLAFAVNVEFAKRLVLAQGADNFLPQAITEIRNWMAFQVEGAQGYLDTSEEQDGGTPELMLLAKQIAEARSWLETLQ